MNAAKAPEGALTTTPPEVYDDGSALDALRVLVEPGTVIEVRAPVRRGRTIRGYYDDHHKLVADVAGIDGQHPGVYVTMNPIDPALLARCANRLQDWAPDATTDPDVIARRWILVDLDPVRATGISATDTQHKAALDKAETIADELTGHGSPDPVLIDSGNGAYVLVPVDLPNDAPTLDLVGRFLAALQTLYGDDGTKIDTSVGNAARIIRLPGTLNAKGDNLPERPHRRSRLLHAPAIIDPTPVELLETIIEEAGGGPEPFDGGAAGSGEFDLAAWLAEHLGITQEPRAWNSDGFKWEITPCPYNPDHNRGEAYVGRRSAGGAIVAGCLHESCTWKWRDLREKYDPQETAQGNDDPKPRRKNRRSKWFNDRGGLLAWDAAKALHEVYPMRLAPGERVAVYRDGVYRPDEPLLKGTIVQMLKNEYRSSYFTTLRQALEGTLALDGAYMPERLSEPLVNVQNGWVDLRTGERRDHTPDLVTTMQLPITHDPDATCPNFDTWLKETAGEQADALLESSSEMLDWTRTPHKALLLYGPSRSGKSTYLRMLERISGPENRSAVALHTLADDKFAAARVYGKILNVAADLSAGHIEDMSIFKMLTGEDPIDANPKYGKPFTFTNLALFAFSANEIPSVGETSRADVERMDVYRFGSSFAGHEDSEIEKRMAEELPGILNRLIRAWQERQARGHARESDRDVRREFEAASDRVQQWLDEEMEIDRTVSANEETAADGFTPSQLRLLFKAWADENGYQALGRNKLTGRLTSKDGVFWVRIGENRQKALNIRRRSAVDPFDGPRTLWTVRTVLVLLIRRMARTRAGRVVAM